MMDATGQRAARNRRIAELLGWRVEERDRGRYYVLIDPTTGNEVEWNGRQVYLDAYYASHDLLETWALVPDFHSLDAVAAALPSDAILRSGDTWAEIKIPPRGWPQKYVGSGDTRQDAAAAALEAYLTAQKGEVK